MFGFGPSGIDVVARSVGRLHMSSGLTRSGNGTGQSASIPLPNAEKTEVILLDIAKTKSGSWTLATASPRFRVPGQ